LDGIEGSAKCKHQCHCACSLEIWTCIINNARR
jgi:hypothetical protein